MKKRIITLTLALVMLMSMAVTASAASVKDFKDVPANSWFYKSVEYCANEGIVAGTSATTFNPNGTMTRLEFVTMLSRLNGTVDYEDLDRVSQNWLYNGTTFTDAPGALWGETHVNWAYRYGLIKPAGDKDFLSYNFTNPKARIATMQASTNKLRPNDPITREEMVDILGKYVILLNADKYLPMDSTAPAAFKDIKQVSNAVYEYAEICRMYGLVVGDNNANLNPKANMTRAEGATVMIRVSQMLVKGLADKVTFPQWMVFAYVGNYYADYIKVGETRYIGDIGLEVYPVGATWTWSDFTYKATSDMTKYGLTNDLSVTKDGYITGLNAGSQDITIYTPDGGTITVTINLSK